VFARAGPRWDWTFREDTTVRIRFERSGGLAGITVALSIDLDEIPKEMGSALREYLQSASPSEGEAGSPGPSFAADRFVYRITVEEQPRHRSVRIDEDRVPPGLQPLLDWLLARARKRRNPVA
jgi:hypothetical protein